MQGQVLERFEFRRARTRRKISELKVLRPRLSVSRTLKHIHAQIIDDAAGKTLVAASSLSPELAKTLKSGGNIAAATAVGELLGKLAVAKGIKQVVYDRGGNVYHGRVKALAEGARKAGLDF